MLNIIVSIFIILILSSFFVIKFDKTIEQGIPFSVLIIIFTLYISYILNIVRVGYFFILIYTCMQTINLFLYLRKTKKIKEILKKTITPGLFIYLTCVVIIYIVTKDNYVMYFDELRLWAAYPKSLFYTENQLINNTFLSTEYFPGMALFQYFVAKCGNAFVDSHLFFSYSLYILSLIIPITKFITWKKWYNIIIAVIFIIFFPLLFANSGFDMLYYYRTLYIDPAMGFTFGFALFYSTKKLSNKYEYILFILSTSAIVLMKSIGLVLAGCVILSYWINQIFIYRIFSNNSKKKMLIKLLIPFFFLLFINFSFKFCCMINSHDTGGDVLGVNLVNALKTLINPTTEDMNLLSEYLNVIKKSPLIVDDSLYSKYLTMPILLLIFSVMMILLAISLKRGTKKIIFSALIFGIFSVIAFYLVFYILYCLVWEHKVLCYGRYLSCVFSGLSLFLMYLIIDNKDNIKIKSSFNVLLIILLLCSYLNIFRINNYAYEKDLENTVKEISNSIAEINDNSENNGKIKKVLTVYNTCNIENYNCVLIQHHMYLDLIDNNILVKPNMLILDEKAYNEFYSTEQNEYFSKDVKSTTLNINDFIEDVDYIVITENIEESNKNIEYINIFGEDISKGNIYAVNEDKSIERIK